MARYLCVAGQAVEVGQRFVHAAVLVAQHRLHLLVAELAVAGDDPIGELLADLQGLLVAAIDIDVLQAGIDLVQRIVGRPDRLERFHAIDERLGIRAQVAAAQFGLALGQSGDHGRGLLLQPLIAGAGVHQRARAEIMPDEVAPHLALGVFPPAQRLGRGGNAGVDAEGVQQPIRIETEQILVVEFLGVLEGAVQQADLRQGERLGLESDLGREPGRRPRRRWNKCRRVER